MEPNNITKTSPRMLARIGGFLYLIIIAAGVCAEAFVRSKMIVAGNATLTAANLKASEQLWRTGVAAELIMLICTITLAWIFYILLKPVSRHLALLATFFNLVSIAIETTNKINLFTALFSLGDEAYLKAFDPDQLNTMASIAIKTHGYGLGISLVFFGCQCVVLGYLLYKAAYFPKILGVLMQVAGLCYLFNSFSLFLAPKFDAKIFPAILVPCFIAELALCLWLIIKGVNLQKWDKAVMPLNRR
jgi:hypothetical protein